MNGFSRVLRNITITKLNIKTRHKKAFDEILEHVKIAQVHTYPF